MSAKDRTGEEVIPRSVSSPRAKLVYLYLRRAGPAAPTEIASGLGLQQLAVYDVLRSLRGRDLVVRRGDGYAVA